MSKIRECFVSRYSDGCLMEADYSQLEIIALAHLSGDHQMAADIRAGTDLHKVRAAQMYSIVMSKVTPQQRQTAKQFSFQLQYGAGAPSMAASCGVAVKIAKNFIAAYYDRYPDVKKWQEAIAAEVRGKRQLSERVTPSGASIGRGHHRSATGRRYVIYEDDNPYYEGGAVNRWGKIEPRTNFSPTKMKNYPVQGFATGDIVPMMLGRIHKTLQGSPWGENVKLINTVHDSIMFDVMWSCNNKRTRRFGMWVKKEMERAPQELEAQFGINFTLPLKVDISVGENWGKMVSLGTELEKGVSLVGTEKA